MSIAIEGRRQLAIWAIEQNRAFPKALLNRIKENNCEASLASLRRRDQIQPTKLHHTSLVH